jgi:hypothetical protein
MRAIPLGGVTGAGSWLLQRLGPAMSVALAGLRLVGDALIEARQMQREARRRYPHFLE